MWRNILSTVNNNISGERILKDLKIINSYDRWFSYSGFDRSVRYAAAGLKRAAGNSKITSFPADGRSRLADYIVPKAWEARSAFLKITDPDIGLSLSYEKVPNSLFMYSYPTKAGGMTAEVVLVGGGAKKEDYKNIDVKGKIIFTWLNPFYVWRHAYEAGAIGILSSWKKGPGTGWVNYCFVPDNTKYKMFGFSLTEPEGRKLEKCLLAEKKKGKKVAARIDIDTSLFNGYGKTAASVVKGKTTEEVLVFGHLYEIGAWDNASGASSIIEIAGCLNELIKRGRLEKPKRNIRFMLGFECYSLMQYLLKKRENVSKLAAGLNIDGVGLPVNKKSILNVNTTPDSNPAAANRLLFEIVEKHLKEKYKYPRIKLNTGRASDDALPGDPCFGVQFPYLIQYSTRNDLVWHSTLDGTDRISKDSLKTSASIAAAYIYFLASAGSKEAVYLAELSAEKTAEDAGLLLNDYKKYLFRSKNSGRGKINSLLDEFREQLNYRCGLGAKEVSSALRFADKKDPAAEALILKQAKTVKALAEIRYNEIEAYIHGISKKAVPFGRVYKELSPLELQASLLVPRRTVPGLLTLETLPEKIKTKNPYGPKYQLTEIPYLWADGKRTLLDIYRADRIRNKGINLKKLLEAFTFLEKYGYIKIRRAKNFEIEKSGLNRIMKKCRLKKGDVIFVHSSLSGLGHIKGGPAAVIAALKKAVGRQGTLVMPAFSWSFPDRKALPFDIKNSRSATGIISEIFRRQKGVLRSNNPTHSVCAWGRHAKEIVNAGAGLPPFDKKGPFGKLLKYNAKVLFLGCGLNANSSLHAVEDWQDLPYLHPELTYFYEKNRIKYKTFAKMPSGCRDFYSHTRKKPAKIYKLLFKAGIIDTVKAGKGVIYSFEMRKFAQTCETILKKDLFILLCDNRHCVFCGKFNKKSGITKNISV